MFTGLIREVATVESFNDNTLRLKARHKAKLGDSIAINGACLTVVALHSNGFSVELSPESQAILSPNTYRGKVHIEPAMMMGDRFEGHIVQGHIDTTATVDAIEAKGNSYDITMTIDSAFIPYIIPKGSITIDGVSLTVNEVFSDSFRLTIIPHTMKETLFREYKVGSVVNVETDMFARYVAHLLSHTKKSTPSWSDIERMHALF